MAMTWEELAAEVYVSIWTGQIIDDTVTRVQGGDFDRLLAQTKAQAQKAIEARNTVQGAVNLLARTARVVVGTSASGWTAGLCDYLCDGVDDQEEINAAIASLPYTGGEVVILDGDYNLTGSISLPAYVTLTGNGHGTRLHATGIDEGAIWLSGDNCVLQNIYLYAESTSEHDIYAISVDGCSYSMVRGCSIDAHRASLGIKIYAGGTGTIIAANEIYAVDSAVYIDGDNSVVVGNIMRCGEGTANMCLINGAQNIVVGNNAAECNGPSLWGKNNVVVGNITRTKATQREGYGSLVIEDDLTELRGLINAMEARLAALEGGNA